MRTTHKTIHTGKRSELAAELRDQSVGWRQRGNDRLSDEAAKGAAELTSGEREVKVGHQVYRVED